MNELLRVVLAEDNPADVLLIREALDAHNVQHELYVLQDGRQASRYIKHIGEASDAFCPDLLLLDINLAYQNGHELLELFRAHPLCAETPVIIVTSSDAEKDRRRAAELGATRYFRKPLDVDEFIRLGAFIREVVEERRPRA